MGIPAGSWFVLNRKKESIQKLQMISENLQDLEKGGTLDHLDPGPDKQEGNTQSLRQKSVIHQQLMASATPDLKRGRQQMRFGNFLENAIAQESGLQIAHHTILLTTTFHAKSTAHWS